MDAEDVGLKTVSDLWRPIGASLHMLLQQAAIQADPERERLMQIIESQAHQLKAAGDVIMYLRSEVDDAKTQVKLLTDSQHNEDRWWPKFCSWFLGKNRLN